MLKGDFVLGLILLLYRFLHQTLPQLGQAEVLHKRVRMPQLLSNLYFVLGRLHKYFLAVHRFRLHIAPY